MVLDEVWRDIEGVEALSGAHGGPLRRTVKLVLDPLVLRPVQYPACAGPMVTAEGAALLATRLRAAAEVLRATAAWFTLLKQVRRTLRITEGHPQDLYFQRCFELATASGRPDPGHDRATAESVLHEIHDVAAGRTTRALRDHLTDPATTARLGTLIDSRWRHRPSHPGGADTAALTALLESCAALRSSGRVTDGRIHDLVAAHTGTRSGIDLWHNHSGSSAQELGLTAHPLPAAPALGAAASTATLALPFDRTVYERVFTVLQASTERSDLPTIEQLVTTEVDRSCAPWALLDESLRVAAAAGMQLALGLSPITTAIPIDAAGDPNRDTTAAHRVVNGRWRREAYVLQARRLVVHDTGAQTGPLTTIAAELHRPWRPYARRLWVRLHGRDVRDAPILDPAELWDLLDGVARSVILDHRSRVKKALSTNTVAAASDTTESKAS
ncbi:hypothetical protein AB0L57_10390 [Nocardia sp. NPDC052254]|uniref:hypothetical protein n=1 Tax=Nocardia sp. NPDC052254 TaxID=3155681 RepID=UPI003435CDA9